MDAKTFTLLPVAGLLLAAPLAAQSADDPAADPAAAARPAPDRARSAPRAPGRAAAADTFRLGLEEAVRRATVVNEDVLMARSEKARAAGIVTETRADAFPRITADFGYTRNIQTPVLFFGSGDETQQIRIGNDNEYNFGLSLRQTVLDFSLGPARQAARLSRRASDARLETVRNDVALRTREVYYRVLLNQALVRVREQALAQAERRLEQVRSFHRAGTGSEFDLLTARVEVENLRPDLIEARNQLELSRNRLKRTIGVPLERPLALTDSFPEPTPSPPESAHVEEALTARPDLEGQRVRVRLQEENLTSRERTDLPTLELVAGLTRRASSNDLLPPEEDFVQTASAGLAFSVPLFDGNRQSGQVQQAKAARNREQYRLRQLRENVRLEVQQAYQAMEAARERIEATASTVERAERALEIAQTRFQNGLSTQVELNDAELAVTQARTNHVRALHAYAVAKARLTAATGER